MPVIKFLTSDDIIIETDDQIAQCSDIIRPLLVCCTEEGDPPKLKGAHSAPMMPGTHSLSVLNSPHSSN
ncbi:uncharacterized protein [Drosophila virilis]|uniref:uncharacterized protein isoform X2 n=1 Tax=Drosophila virilis TaxID=7244 RepID=UPI0038B2871A